MVEENKEALEFIIACMSGFVIFLFALPFVIRAIKNSFLMHFATAITNTCDRFFKSWLQAWRDIFGKEDKQ